MNVKYKVETEKSAETQCENLILPISACIWFTLGWTGCPVGPLA